MKPVQLRTLLLMLLIAASGIIVMGAFAKIQRWPVANMLLPVGMLLEIGCAIGLIVLSWRSRAGR